MKMIWLVLLTPSLLLAQPPPPAWKKVAYEKIILPNHTPEAVVLTKNEKSGQITYSISYQVGERTFSTRALPAEIYTQMKSKLAQDVLSLTKADVQGTCVRFFDFEEGTFEANPDSSQQAKLKKSTRYCLSATKHSRTAEDSFARWYRNARELLGL